MSVTQERRPNGVDTTTLFATIGAVRQQPELAQFRFRAVNDWVRGTHSEGRFPGSTEPGRSTPTAPRPSSTPTTRPCWSATTTAPPRPSCCSTPWRPAWSPGWATSPRPVASSSTGVRCTVEGDIDLRGILGIDDAVRNGFEDIRVEFEVDGDGTAEQLAELVAQSRARSAVFDVLTHGTAVTVEVVERHEQVAHTRERTAWARTSTPRGPQPTGR